MFSKFCFAEKMCFAASNIGFFVWKYGKIAYFCGVEESEESEEKDPDEFGAAITGKWLPRKDLGNVEVYAEVATADMMSGNPQPEVNVGVIINGTKRG